MLNIVSSTAEEKSPYFVQSERKGRGKNREDNLAWLERHVQRLTEIPGGRGRAYLVLLGGREGADFHLRVAQGHLRHDMSPSHWSHVVLLGGAGWTRKRSLWEISLEPPGGFGYPPSDNGVQNGTLDPYRSAYKYPNVAVLRLPVALADMKRALGRFKKQRTALDAVELILVWLAYVWGAGRAINPLLDGNGMPSAAMIELLASAAGLDLTPGLESRASCPEAIWQSARWWHGFYEGDGDGGAGGNGGGESGDDAAAGAAAGGGERALHGFWHTEHYLG